MFRYKLRTLLFLLAILPPVVATIAPPLVQWFRQKPPPSPATAANPSANSAPYFASYATGPADPQMTENVTRTLLAGTPVRMQLDSKTGKLSVWGPPSAHKAVQAIIGEMQRESTTVTIRKDGSVLTETGRYRTKK